MSGNKIYQGRFAELLRAFIEEKRSLGCRYKEEERLSFIFDQLSLNYDCSDGLTAELADAFTGYQPNWQATTQKRRISFIQNFGAYLLRHDIQAFRAGYAVMRNMQPEFKPYIFSHTEMDQFFAMADNIRPNCRNSHIFYPVLFRMLYGTGIRISEALSLTMDDVDLKEQVLRVINPKNHKDRILPISDSVTEYCRWYQGKIHPFYHKDDLFFKSNRGTGCYYRPLSRCSPSTWSTAVRRAAWCPPSRPRPCSTACAASWGLSWSARPWASSGSTVRWRRAAS